MKIAAYPRGLLASLGAQNRGQALQELGETLIPTLDQSQRYALDGEFPLRILTGAGTLNALGYIELSNLTANALIGRLDAISAQVVTGGANSCEWNLQLELEGQGSNASMPLSETIVQGVNQTRTVICPIAPLLLPPGARLGIFVSNLVGTPTGSVQTLWSASRT